MARGDFTVFKEFAIQLGQELHTFASDTLKLGLVDPRPQRMQHQHGATIQQMRYQLVGGIPQMGLL